MIRKRKKINKMRGSRTVGGGSSKKRRGAGHRGGRGQAGGHKHHWTWIVKHDPEHFGKRGFKRPRELVKDLKTINLGEIQEKLPKFIKEGIAQKEKNITILDLTRTDYDKVLGQGKITEPLHIKAHEFSAQAKEKIKEAGGKTETID
ncbi:MAG TPA: uL15m family ribosomal protein [Methanothermobacter sp.]|nr:50S ribosomal protein L15P [Methanothermobacter sp. MT-2]HHW04354.1 50S ribosomal protein L15 [Methanothermobacter sp.]HOK72396.1 uL15m family ribosomal protein [Methanothermobacter sp.]HOL69201.1 uL15m family ribosomal protein [Methanothermobacter sp.]HPQ03883.1 uL15m family ribosomal protein [Methanothermobacter sp.]